jgi:DNA primase
MIPDAIVDQVREHADIVAIIGELMKLKRVGNSFRGPCPFHQGKDANFSVSPRGTYMCFVCHEKGDVFSFVQKRLGLDFVDAVKYVGAKSGIEVKEITRDRSGGAPDPREKLWEINAAAAEFFGATLWSDELGAPAREYLSNRQMDRDIAERFGLGFAPRDPMLLRSHLHALGYDDARQVEAGLLVVRNEGEEPRPRFRNRLMFPIYDPQNRVIAFGGRVIAAAEPKYLNSAESPTFQKGSTLYGLNWAKNSIRKDGRVLLVEGYFDCVRLVAAGLESTVAPLGTALTDSQAELLRKYTTTVFLLYDSDKAGLKATFRAGDVLLRQGFKVHVVTLPSGDDPDTFVVQHGREGLESQLAGAIDVFERKLQILQRGGWFTDLRRKRVALDRLLPTIRAAADPITYGLYLARAAEVAGINEDVLRRELKDVGGRKETARTSRRAPKAVPGRRASDQAAFSAEMWLVHLLLTHAQLREEAAERVGPNEFRDARLRAIFAKLLDHLSNNYVGSVAEELPEHAVELYSELQRRPPMPNPLRVLNDSIAQLKTRDIADQLDEIEKDLPYADEIGKNELLIRQGSLFRDLKELGGKRWKTFQNRPQPRGE